MKAFLLAFMTALSSAHAGSVYDHKLKDIDGKDTSLAQHKGKVILMVNVASRCGFTGQYKGLEELHKKFKDKGLVVCGFPCNQFGKQINQGVSVAKSVKSDTPCITITMKKGKVVLLLQPVRKLSMHIS